MAANFKRMALLIREIVRIWLINAEQFGNREFKRKFGNIREGFIFAKLAKENRTLPKWRNHGEYVRENLVSG